jgi:hypothetical protein
MNDMRKKFLSNLLDVSLLRTRAVNKQTAAVKHHIITPKFDKSPVNASPPSSTTGSMVR